MPDYCLILPQSNEQFMYFIKIMKLVPFSGASISTRGRYFSPAEKEKNDGKFLTSDRPLYLHIHGPTRQSLDCKCFP